MCVYCLGQVGVLALWCLRRGERVTSVLVLVVGAGLELLLVVAVAAFRVRVDDVAVKIILLAHGGVVAAALAASVWVVLATRRAQRKLLKDLVCGAGKGGLRGGGRGG